MLIDGKIILYNLEIGTGKIILKTKKVINFSIDMWKDFENLPKFSLEVEVEFSENNKILGIETKTNKSKEIQDDKKIENKIKIETKNSKNSSKEIIKNNKLQITKKTGNSNNSKLLGIAESNMIDRIKNIGYINQNHSITKCINDYLSSIAQQTIKYQNFYDDRPDNENLNFLGMKRFIFTAYNNLYDLDPNFFDEELKNLKDDLNQIHLIQDDLFKKTSQIKSAFETIFLNKQKEYLIILKAFENIKQEVNDLKIDIYSMGSKLKDEKKQLLKLSKKNEQYKELSLQIKKTAGFEVDLIHKQSILKEENNYLYDLLISFKKQYNLIFVKEFKKSAIILDKEFLKILDAKAYDLDYRLWVKAKKSKNVREFFAKSKIDGNYSSKTYLKYYLKHIDSNVETSEDINKLQELLTYLQSVTEKYILILMNNINEVNIYQEVISNVDKDFDVRGSSRVLSSLYFCKQKKPHLIILGQQLTEITPSKFIQEYKEAYGINALNTQFCLLGKNFNKENIINGRKAGFKYFIDIKTPKDEIAEKIRLIL